jgi:hypothetical protein
VFWRRDARFAIPELAAFKRAAFNVVKGTVKRVFYLQRCLPQSIVVDPSALRLRALPLPALSLQTFLRPPVQLFPARGQREDEVGRGKVQRSHTRSRLVGCTPERTNRTAKYPERMQPPFADTLPTGSSRRAAATAVRKAEATCGSFTTRCRTTTGSRAGARGAPREVRMLQAEKLQAARQ